VVKTRNIDSSESKLYEQKANEFFKVMESCFEKKQWNGVGLSAVHCVISINDALLAKSGIRNTSADHREAARLLIRQYPSEETKKKAKHLKKVIEYKNIVEYHGRLFSQKEAVSIMKHTTRFFDWVVEQL